MDLIIVIFFGEAGGQTKTMWIYACVHFNHTIFNSLKKSYYV